MRIAILDDYQNGALTMADWSPVKAKADLTVFQDHVKDLDRLVERLGDFEAIVIMRERTPFPRALIERLPKLKLLSTSGMTNRSIDLAAATDHQVMVCGTDNVGTTTGELAWGLILGLARNIPREHRATREGFRYEGRRLEPESHRGALPRGGRDESRHQGRPSFRHGLRGRQDRAHQPLCSFFERAKFS